MSKNKGKLLDGVMTAGKKGRKIREQTENEKLLASMFDEVKVIREKKEPLTAEEKAKVEQYKEINGKVQAENFHRLATYRLKKIVKAIEQFGYLANSSQYKYRPEQVEVIMATLYTAVDNLNGKFNPKDVVAKGIEIPV